MQSIDKGRDKGMKLFRACAVNELSLRTKLAARLVLLDIALMQATEKSRRGPFRHFLRASIRRLRDELRREA
jgi:hypothetical protein